MREMLWQVAAKSGQERLVHYSVAIKGPNNTVPFWSLAATPLKKGTRTVRLTAETKESLNCILSSGRMQ